MSGRDGSNAPKRNRNKGDAGEDFRGLYDFRPDNQGPEERYLKEVWGPKVEGGKTGKCPFPLTLSPEKG